MTWADPLRDIEVSAMIGHLRDLRCAGGSADVVLISPGRPPIIDVQTDIMIGRGEPITATCLACWRPARERAA